MWKLISDVDDVITANTASVVSVVRSIRQQPKFDVAVLFPNSLRTALEVWLGGIPRRVGYRGHHRAWLLNQIVRERGKPRPPEHQARRYLRMAESLGAKADASSAGESPSLTGIVSFSRDASSVPYSPAALPTNPMRLGLCPGAEYGPAKRWLPERFAEAAGAVVAKYPVEWVLFGKTSDAAIGEAIAKTLGERCVNRIGQTTLQQLIDELRTCRLLLTNDTGTMHLAALLGIPTVAIFGSTEPQLTGPLGNNHVILRHHVECSPCFLRQCPIDFRCMKAVEVNEVVNRVLSLLKSDGSIPQPPTHGQ
jgi:lipopolysaccharide heptosyltransferase II